MAEFKKKMVSNFAQLLLKVAMNMTLEDLSNMKLLLRVDSHITMNCLHDLQHPSDLVLHLSNCKFVDKHNLGFLINLLVKIRRCDLANDLQKYEKDHKHSDSRMSVDDSDESLPSSQESICDEEKLQQREKQWPRVADENTMYGLEDNRECT